MKNYLLVIGLALLLVGNVKAQVDQETFQQVEQAAKQGNADAQCLLGVYYYNGIVVSQDYAQAVYWYRKAAEQGDAIAQYCLGECYYVGNGVSQDYTQAVYWYRPPIRGMLWRNIVWEFVTMLAKELLKTIYKLLLGIVKPPNREMLRRNISWVIVTITAMVYPKIQSRQFIGIVKLPSREMLMQKGHYPDWDNSRELVAIAKLLDLFNRCRAIIPFGISSSESAC